MKTNKVTLLTAFFAVLLFAACTEDIVREPSPIANPASTNVYFSVTNKTSPVLALEQNELYVSVIREKSTAAQEVALIIENLYGDTISIPSKVSFKAGEDSVALKITVKDMKLMKKYKIAISVDPQQSNPYVAQPVYPRIDLNILKEDFAPFADGTYSSEFFEDEWDQLLEYSPATKIYRMKDCWMPGYNVTFKWDEAAKPGEVTIVGTTTSAKDFIFIPTGYVHSTYGMVSAYYPTANKNYYDSASKTFTFPIGWYIPDGRTFGDYADKYVITKLY